jgi:large subunit ribosomal protein L9
MEVILLSRVAKLGQMGEIVAVKPGYARNYLLPKKLALRLSEKNRKLFEEQKQELANIAAQQKQAAEDQAKTLDGLVCDMLRQAADSGALFGSVSRRDVAKNLAERGIQLNVEQIELPKVIKLVGIYDITIHLHADVSRTIQLVVGSSAEQLVELRKGDKEQGKTTAAKATQQKPDQDDAAEEALLAD